MDIFVEQIVRHKKSSSDYTKQTVALLGGVVAVLAMVYISLYLIGFLGVVGMILSLAAIAGIIYGTIRIITSFNVEYEYILTNGELDVDKIIAKSDRKRLVTVDVKGFTAFGRVTQNVLDADYSTRIYAFSDYAAPDACYAVFEKPDMGKTLLIFNPNDAFCRKIYDFLPADVKNGVK